MLTSIFSEAFLYKKTISWFNGQLKLKQLEIKVCESWQLTRAWDLKLTVSFIDLPSRKLYKIEANRRIVKIATKSLLKYKCYNIWMKAYPYK